MSEVFFSVLISDAFQPRMEMSQTPTAEHLVSKPFIFISDSIAVTGSHNHYCVPKSDIVEHGYDLSINRYKEVVHEVVDHRAPQAMLESIEKEITSGMKELRGMLK